MIDPLVDKIAALKPSVMIHSDMIRTRALAQSVASRLGISCIAEPLWRERNFGDWEGQTWSAIYQQTGNAMDGMVDDPDHFRPGGGETTSDVMARVRLALTKYIGHTNMVIISHGGPLACAQVIQKSLPITALARNIPPLGSVQLLCESRPIC
jgi:broad specificity phosphatase PhoE